MKLNMEYNPHEQETLDKSPKGATRVHHRVAARLKSVVKNLGIKPKKKEPQDK